MTKRQQAHRKRVKLLIQHAQIRPTNNGGWTKWSASKHLPKTRCPNLIHLVITSMSHACLNHSGTDLQLPATCLMRGLHDLDL